VLAAGAVRRKAKEGENMPISRLYGGATARFTREIKRSEFLGSRRHRYAAGTV
jgi:hypothetical protein